MALKLGGDVVNSFIAFVVVFVQTSIELLEFFEVCLHVLLRDDIVGRQAVLLDDLRFQPVRLWLPLDHDD